MNTGDTTFTLYWIALVVSGVLMLVVAGTGFGHASGVSRAINGLFGLGFLGYGVYLGFIFQGGHYLIFFKAFIVPVVLLVNAVRQAFSSRGATAKAPAAGAIPTQRANSPQAGMPAQGMAYPAPYSNAPQQPPQGYPVPQNGAPQGPYQSPIQPG